MLVAQTFVSLFFIHNACASRSLFSKTLISINGPLIIINTRFAWKIDVKLMFN